MSEMIERVAKALYGDFLDNAHPDDAEYWREKARIALEAMRLPTETMTKQGSRGWLNVADRTDCGKESERYTRAAGRAWTAMIDSALSNSTHT